MDGDLPASANLLDVAALVEMFETAEDATATARQLSERDRDYVDNIQYTAEEIKELNRRKQPVTIANRIKRKRDFLIGYEMSQRVDPRAMPRTPRHEEDAGAVQQALRYVAETERFDQLRSRVFDNLLVEGMGGYRVGVKPGYDGAMEITLNRVAWDRMFYDPHSSEPDFSDAGYLGGVVWKDFDEAAAEYPDAIDALNTTLDAASITDTYDDRPKFRIWADKKRKRVRVVYMWIKRGDQWHFAEFTKGGILKAGPSPYVTDKGESDCELVFGSAYVNRENERYGLVREMISIQDEINKRRSKALHLLNVNQTTMEEGAVQDVEKYRREAARPDGVKIINPGYFDKIASETRVDLAQGHMQLLQEAKGEIDMMAGNIALQGNALQKSAASGKAIIASQQGGAMEVAPIMDSLRDMDVRVFRAIWYRIRQFWTAKKWVRVTDDERNVKWLGLNIPPEQGEALMAQNPDKIAGTVASIAELDCDIIIDDAPDGLTPQLEQFQSLVELKKMDANGEMPFRAIVAAMPNLKNKEQVMSAMDDAKQPPPEVAQLQERMKMLEMAMMEAKVADTQASAALKSANAQRAMMPEGQPPQQVETGLTDAELMEIMASAEQKQSAAVLNYARAEQVGVETMLAPRRAAQQAMASQMKAEQPFGA